MLQGVVPFGLESQSAISPFKPEEDCIGHLVSLLATPGDNAVGYVFNARTFGTPADRPMLIIDAVAVPEPSAAAMALAAGAVLAFTRRRAHARRR